MESVVLFGNGLNLVGGRADAWDELLKNVSALDNLPKLSNTLDYECIFLNYCNESNNTSDGKTLQKEYQLKSLIAEHCSRFQLNRFYSLLSHLPNAVYLTTNYDGLLEKQWTEDGFDENVELTNNAESIYSIRRCHAFSKNEKIKRVFPIHGDYRMPKTIMIGYDHYCGSLGKLDDYFKGKYAYKVNAETTVKLPRLLDRLDNKMDSIVRQWGKYWPDYFFSHNVHIIGLGLSPVESDIWWVLNKRCRYKQVRNTIKNHIYFYGDPQPRLSQLLEAFDVEIVRVKLPSAPTPNQWQEQYENMFDMMNNRMNNKR